MINILKDFYRKIYPYGQNLILQGKILFIEGKNYCLQKKAFLIKIFIPFFIIGFGYCSCVYSQHIVIKNIREIFSISEAVRQYYADKPSYWGLDTEYAIQQNIVPQEIVKNKKLKLNGGIDILIGSGIDGNKVMPMEQSFDVILPNLNKAQCMSYAEANLLDNEKLALISLSIINSSGTYIFGWGEKNTLPVKKYSTKKLCQDKENTLIWSLK